MQKRQSKRTSAQEEAAAIHFFGNSYMDDIELGSLSTFLADHKRLKSAVYDHDKLSYEKKEKKLLQELSDALSKVKRFEQQIVKKDRTIENQKKQLETMKPKAETEKEQNVYVGIIKDVVASYTSKAQAVRNKEDAPSVQSSQALSTVIRIIQLNSNPTYHTEREVRFLDHNQAVAAGMTRSGWVYDMSTPPNPWKPQWKAFSNDNVERKLQTLGVCTFDSFNKTLASFAPTVGQSVVYSIGQHDYTTSVTSGPAPQAPLAASSSNSDQQSWKHKVLFEGDFFKFSIQYIDDLLRNNQFDGPDTVIGDSTEVAALAEMWSSFGQCFKYDSKKSELWVKPNWIRMWLRVAKERKYFECRILMHGMRSQNYHLLAKDLSGFDFNFSQQGAKRWGFYASCSDHIASEYNACGGGKMPDGSGVIGLLLIKKGAGQGAYEHYHLGSGRPGGPGSSVCDAYAVRDQMLWLPIGLAYAKP